MMKTVCLKLRNIALGFLTLILNIFIRRDKKILLFGSWMGSKFADNPRFLYQHISQNKDVYGIKEIVWVTRNQMVYDEMKEMGYCVYMMHSIQSYYYHIKAGFHIICNIHSSGVFPGDIIGELSHGAIKVQLWHGVAIKASGHTTNVYKDLVKNMGWVEKIKLFLHSNNFINHYIMYPGGWDSPYYLVTSEENARVMKNCFEIKDEKLIMSSYPRWYPNNEYTRSETIIINKFTEFKKKYKAIILYLPTFRDGIEGYNKYIHPLKVKGILDYIGKNNILWVEKAHNASTFKMSDFSSINQMKLDMNFDIDLVYNYADLVITDYSSVSSDAIFKDIKTLYFVPDYDGFLNRDRGFVNIFELYCPGYIVKNTEKLLYYLDLALFGDYFDEDMKTRYKNTKELLFGYKQRSMNDIVLDILKIE